MKYQRKNLMGLNYVKERLLTSFAKSFVVKNNGMEKRSHHLDSTSILPSGCDDWGLTSPPGIRTSSASCVERKRNEP